jgi:hypothetical protein
MSSRQGSDSKGVLYVAPPENAAAMTQRDIFYSGGRTSNPSLTALTGQTIRGLVVGPLEHWADGTIWDINNNRALSPATDFDPAILHRSGF